MPTAWQKRILSFLQGVQTSALVICAIGGLQVLASLLVWQVLFRSYPLGFSMALTLVGFGSWLLSSLAGLGTGQRRFVSSPMRPLDNIPMLSRVPERTKERIERSGCGCMLFISSLIPLGIALALRLQADFRAGKSWSDVFPPGP